MKIGIVGSRDRTEPMILNNIRVYIKNIVSSEYFDDLHIISGGCPTGADNYAEIFASTFDLSFTKHPAKWKKYGKKAGPIRNTLIAKESDMLIAFPSPRGTGTQDTMRKFKQYHPNGVLLEL